MATATALLTIDEYLALPHDGRRTELVRGRIVEVPPTGFEHGQICAEVIFLLKVLVKRVGAGKVIGNDSGIMTRRDPDTLRGPDVSYYGPAKAQTIGVPKGCPDVKPDLIIEVRSPSDRWPEIVAKATEYLAAGVPIVILLDPATRSAHVYEADRAPRILGPDETLTLPDLLGDFAVVVRQIFE